MQLSSSSTSISRELGSVHDFYSAKVESFFIIVLEEAIFEMIDLIYDVYMVTHAISIINYVVWSD